jgi:hypothetical protein
MSPADESPHVRRSAHLGAFRELAHRDEAPLAPTGPTRVVAFVFRGEEIGRRLLAALAEGGAAAVERTIQAHADDPALADGLLFACQSCAPEARGEAPLALAEITRGFADATPPPPPLAELLRAEAALLASVTRLARGEVEPALRLAREARLRLEASEAPAPSLARALEQEANALLALGESGEAAALRRRATKILDDESGETPALPASR